MMDRKPFSSFDLWFLLVIILILAMGVLSIYSVTNPSRSSQHLPVYVKQMIWIFIGWIFFFAFAFYDYRKMSRYSLALYSGCVLLLILVLIIGRTGHGSQRWISLGFFDIQPSEWIKLPLILVIANYLAGRQRPRGLGLGDLVPLFLMVLLPLFLVLKQPDLGTALVLLFLLGIMIFLAGFRSRRVGFFILVSIMSFPFIWELFWKSLKGYQRNRLATFFNPSLDPMGQGYHALQSKIAIGSGGLWGRGFWGGTQSQLKFLPEGHTDFIFSVFAEEWGFAGVSILFVLYLLLVWWGVTAAFKAKDALGTLIAGGVVAIMLFYIIVNIGMTVGIAPVVGVPLPLMSYGGNSLVTTMAALGLLLNIRLRRFMLFY